MRWRLAVLLALAALSLAYRGMAVYMRYFSPDTQTRANYQATFKDGAMVVTQVDLECTWPADQTALCNADPHPGDRIVEIYDGKGGGGPVRGIFDYGAFLKPIDANDSWEMVVERPLEGGGWSRVSIRMPPAIPLEWSLGQWLTNLGYDVYLPMLALAAGLLIGFMRPMDNQAFLAALVFLGFSTSFGQNVSQFPVVWRELALFFGTTAFVFSPYLILRFFLCFPTRSILARKTPWLSPLVLGATVAVWLVELAKQFALFTSFETHEVLITTLGSLGLTGGVRLVFFRIAWIVLLLVCLAALTLNTIQAESRNDRRRMIIILTGAVAGLVPPSLVVLFYFGNNPPPVWFLLIGILLIGLFPISFVYAVVRYRVFGIRLILRRGLKYALVSRGFLIIEGIVLFLALYFAAAPLLSRLLPGSGPSVASVSVAALTLGLVAGTRSVNRKVLPAIDRRFFRDAYNTQRILTDLSSAVRQLASRPDRLLTKVTDEIVAALHPSQVSVFLIDRPWPELSPQERDPVRWKADGISGIDLECLLFVHRAADPAENPVARTSSLGDGDYVLSSSGSLARLLTTSAEQEPETLGIFPLDPDRSAPGRVAAPSQEDPMGDRELFGRFDARLVVPLVTAGRPLGFLVLGEKRSEEPYSSEDKELLLAVAEQSAIALDYSLLIGRVAEQQKLEREVQIAQEVQARLFPQELPSMETLRYTGVCRTARGVGGDYYDFLRLGRAELGIAVADIAGKGLPAALLMASLQALVRSQTPSHAEQLGALATEINRHLFESTDDARFATLFLGVYDDRARSLRFVSAGHNPPILVRPSTTGGVPEVRRLETGGMVVGVLAERSYTQSTVDLRAGDLLVVFSDGIVEAMNERDEEFGDERLVDLVTRHADLDADGLQKLILREVDAFLGGLPAQDDITLIVARVV